MTIEEIKEKIEYITFCRCFSWKNKIYLEFSNAYEGELYAIYDIKKGELKLCDSWSVIDNEQKKEVLEVCNEIKPIKKCTHDGSIYGFVRSELTFSDGWKSIQADEKAINEMLTK